MIDNKKIRFVLLVLSLLLLQSVNGQWSYGFGFPSNNIGSFSNSFSRPNNFNFGNNLVNPPVSFQQFKPFQSGFSFYDSLKLNVPTQSPLSQLFQLRQPGESDFTQRMNTILPPQNGIGAHKTGDYGEMRKKGLHGGIDLNYDVPGQRGINLQNPPVHSPVSGKVTFVGGQYGTVKIRTDDGYSHELLHLDKTKVNVGDIVTPGKIIGTMGGRGPHGSKQHAQHVHYQVKDPKGNNKNPEDY